MKLVDKILRWRGKHFYRAPQVLTDLDYHLCWKWNMEMGKCDSVWRFWVVWTAEIGPFVPDKTGWYNLEPLDQSYSKKKSLLHKQYKAVMLVLIFHDFRRLQKDKPRFFLSRKWWKWQNFWDGKKEGKNHSVFFYSVIDGSSVSFFDG